MKPVIKLPLRHLYRIPPERVFDLTIELALTTGVKLLVCGNRLPFYEMAYVLARQVGQRYEIILREKIFFARAETGPQLVDFLSEMEADPIPVLVTDLLARFKDEDDEQIDDLFFTCQIELQRLSLAALIFVSSAMPSPPHERLGAAFTRITQKVDWLN